MGLLDKIKDLFTDEEVVEVPIQKEVIKVEIASPKKNEETVNDITDSSIIKEDTSPTEKNTNIFFNEEDFEDLNNKKEVTPAFKSSYMIKKQPEDKQPFKPSPIISPVYGILDKNYHKDDIMSKKRDNDYRSRSTNEITIDDIRKKAFGTLEEELEQEMFSSNIVFEEEVAEEEDLFEELIEDFEDISINGEFSDDNITEEESLEDEISNILESDTKLNESDLFNLIDSMYEKGDDEE